MSENTTKLDNKSAACDSINADAQAKDELISDILSKWDLPLDEAHKAAMFDAFRCGVLEGEAYVYSTIEETTENCPRCGTIDTEPVTGSNGNEYYCNVCGKFFVPSEDFEDIDD